MIARALIIITVLSTLSGCAKFPSTPPTSGKQLVITLKVSGTIKPFDELTGTPHFYFVAIDNDGNDLTGPLAVMGPPYGGEGWVTSNDARKSIGMTSYLRYDSTIQNNCLFTVFPGTFFLNARQLSTPIQEGVIDNGTTLRFVVDFSQIATAAIPADQIRSLNINFITTNSLPISNNPSVAREYDGLGPTGQNPVLVNTTSDNFYQGDNADGHAVSDIDLDIIYWSIEVQTFGSH